jgi:hypothetical protein
MTNKGVEVLLTVTPVLDKRFSWDITGNFTRIRNKVVSIGNGITSFSILAGSSLVAPYLLFTKDDRTV